MYLRGRKTSATKGAAEMRREMLEEQAVVAASPVKSVSDDTKGKKGKKREKQGGETPMRARKQPKRAAKSKSK